MRFCMQNIYLYRILSRLGLNFCASIKYFVQKQRENLICIWVSNILCTISCTKNRHFFVNWVLNFVYVSWSHPFGIESKCWKRRMGFFQNKAFDFWDFVWKLDWMPTAYTSKHGSGVHSATQWGCYWQHRCCRRWTIFHVLKFFSHSATIRTHISPDEWYIDVGATSAGFYLDRRQKAAYRLVSAPKSGTRGIHLKFWPLQRHWLVNYA